MGGMAADFIIALLYIIVVWLVGQCTISRLLEEKAYGDSRLLSFAVGFAELTLLSTFFYFTCKMPVQAIRVIWAVLAVAALVDLIRRRELKKADLPVLVMVLGLWLILLIPGILGGDQYYVYRGNCTDQQTYVEETVALSTHSIGWYESRTGEEIELVSDVLWRGYKWAVKDRPSAGLMIAVMRANPAGEIYWVVYLYRMFMQAIILTSLLYLFGSVLDQKEDRSVWQKLIWLLAAALYCVGLWGQLQYDIDAVSQMSSIAVLTALTALFFQYAQEIIENQVWNKKLYFLVILLAAAGLALYLESSLVHGTLYLASGILLLIRTKKKLDWKRTGQLAGIPVIALGLLILSNYRIVTFLIGQINTSVSDGRQEWANYFNAWWLGKHGIDTGRIKGPISKWANGIVSTSGMYNMTVNYQRHYGLTSMLLTGIVALLALLVVFCLVRPFFRKMQQSVWLLWVVTLTGVVIVAGMCVDAKYWSAGKLLYYISPYLYTFLCVPALQVGKCKGVVEKLALCLAAVLLFSNGKMVLEKCNDVRVNWACLGYRGNYPSDMIPGLKMTTDFNFDTEELEGIDGVVIRDLSMVSDHQFYLQYLKVKLTCAGIPWIPENDINYYQDPVETSAKRTLQGNLATLEAVQNEAGRYEIRIVKE